MRTRSFMLLGGFVVLAAAAVLVGHQALAGQTTLRLKALDSHYPLGGETSFLVQIDPGLVGGQGELYAQVNGFEREWVMDFAFELPEFTLIAPVPGNPAYAGHVMTFRYEAFDLLGHPVGVSTPAKRPIPPDMPEGD